jgi:hypothetical protein
MAIIRRMVNEGKDWDLRPLPKVRMPRLTSDQLSLFPEL